ncbi:hypothetical protein [Amycolatopsis sp. 3B14]|uniref:hypothetical protein n=1 Tax=Amycolatopsis sp. 3B14 TaxID=3243600 RepID=UPI003D963ECF
MTGDPHIHVERGVAHAGSALRGLVASTFGLIADAPVEVTTGCGARVPYAMTSTRPESVTCLACREHARREHLRLAGQVELLGRTPGAPVSAADAASAARGLRDLAERYAG